MVAVLEAARVLGLEMQVEPVQDPEGFDSAFEAVLRQRAEALYTVGSPLLAQHRAQIVQFGLQHRLPTMLWFRPSVEAGGLMTYTASLPAMGRRAAVYVDKILKGAKPADLPVEQPMTFDFVVNMKTAAALGVTFPNEIMLQVTEVIQ
jgi:putative ABC transport system substrate-binding protein